MREKEREREATNKHIFTLIDIEFDKREREIEDMIRMCVSEIK